MSSQSSTPSVRLSKPDKLIQYTLRFALDDLGSIRRTAHGLQDTPALLMHLWHPIGRRNAIQKFCIHPTGDEPLSHIAYDLDADDDLPSNSPCANSPNRLIYQLNRIAWRYLRNHPQCSRSKVEEMIRLAIQEMHKSCIVCSRPTAEGDIFLRSICCSDKCSLEFSRAPLEIRIPELVSDPMASTVILEALYHAVLCGHLDLLPPLPPELSEKTIISLLNHRDTLLDAFSQRGRMAPGRPRQPPQTSANSKIELFLSWAFTAYRGCLIDINAPSHPHTTNLPQEQRHNHEFFLINAKPDQELSFAHKLALAGGTSAIVFHGTTFDRIYPILSEGLLTQTRPGLVQTGSRFGSGVYTASKSSVAFHYAERGAKLQEKCSQLSQQGDSQHQQQGPSSRQGKRKKFDWLVVLVCELVQPDRHKKSSRSRVSDQPCDIYVTNDSSNLIVRGLYIIAPGAPFPDVDAGEMQRRLRLLRGA